MTEVAGWFASTFSNIPLGFLEVWGRVGFFVGIVLMLAAY